ncbi:hypothetical protein [Providencia manganoxydans]|uniref:hypothetical protein n=1 Tax=Providencia manganoxydans TaxID=2923283 RepID=UPI0032DA4845
MSKNYIDRYEYRKNMPNGFHCAAVQGGHFSHVLFDSEPVEITGADGKKETKIKEKYGFVLAVPFDNDKLKMRETEHRKYTCSKEDYEFLKSVADEITEQPVYVTFLPNAWATSRDNNGVWYQYVSDTLKRFDGKPLTPKK